MKTMDAAKGKWRGILGALGVDQRFLRDIHGECPMCGGKDRYRFDDSRGEGRYFCSGCGSGDGMDLLMGVTGKNFQEAAEAVDEIINNVTNDPPVPAGPDPRVRLRKLAIDLGKPEGINSVRLYLNSRSLAASEITQLHTGLGYYEQGKHMGTYPAMVHLFRNAGGEPITYHVTYLTTRGQKAPVDVPKKILPPLSEMNGGAIRLSPARRHMGIAEGIETAMAAEHNYGIPVWATANAHLLEKWQPPEGVEEVWIFSDNDSSFTGQKSAFILAHRLKRDGLKVIVKMPVLIDTDFADEVADV